MSEKGKIAVFSFIERFIESFFLCFPQIAMVLNTTLDFPSESMESPLGHLMALNAASPDEVVEKKPFPDLERSQITPATAQLIDIAPFS